ncbi:MAG: hypothetical protein HY360_04285 [Verrucomicrobia bacterium]|nr:hypothetical protein [Verrucomicrobiota bacterium]
MGLALLMEERPHQGPTRESRNATHIIKPGLPPSRPSRQSLRGEIKGEGVWDRGNVHPPLSRKAARCKRGGHRDSLPSGKRPDRETL